MHKPKSRANYKKYKKTLLYAGIQFQIREINSKNY